MKEIKWLLGVLLGIIWSSSWWAAAVFGHITWESDNGMKSLKDLWFVPAILTGVIIIWFTAYCVDNWWRAER